MWHVQVCCALQICDLRWPLAAFGTRFVQAFTDLPEFELDRLSCDIYLSIDKRNGERREYQDRQSPFRLPDKLRSSTLSFQIFPKTSRFLSSSGVSTFARVRLGIF
jgi:hypothetical protein